MMGWAACTRDRGPLVLLGLCLTHQSLMDLDSMIRCLANATVMTLPSTATDTVVETQGRAWAGAPRQRHGLGLRRVVRWLRKDWWQNQAGDHKGHHWVLHSEARRGLGSSRTAVKPRALPLKMLTDAQSLGGGGGSRLRTSRSASLQSCKVSPRLTCIYGRSTISVGGE